MTKSVCALLVFTVCMAQGVPSGARTLKVGPEHALKRPSEAARVARDGDVVEIAAGVYRRDVALWRQSDLTLRARGGEVVLDAQGTSFHGKGIWVTLGRNTLIEGITFKGAAAADGFASGVRHQGLGLTVRNSRFVDNEMGLLTHNDGRDRVTLLHSEFARSGPGPRHNHNVYIGRIERFEMRGCYVHHARIGHNVKSRARTNRLLYNLITDADDGFASYAVEFPEGGDVLMVGNVVQQSRFTHNMTLVSYGAARHRHGVNRLRLLHNTLIDDHGAGALLRVHDSASTISLVNNLFVGDGRMYLGPPARQTGNVSVASVSFPGRFAADYRTGPDPRVVDKGTPPGRETGFDAAVWEYRHERRLVARVRHGRAPDPGAFEIHLNSRK